MVDTGNLTGGVIGFSITFSLWKLLFLVVLGLSLGYIYNRAIVFWHKQEDEEGKPRYVPTWVLVVIGVALGLGLLATIHWFLALLVFVVYAGLGIPLAWGDASRERAATLDYARFMRKKNRLLTRPHEASEL